MKLSLLKHLHHRNHASKCTLEILKINDYHQNIVRGFGFAVFDDIPEEKQGNNQIVQEGLKNVKCLTKCLNEDTMDYRFIHVNANTCARLLLESVNRRGLREGKIVHSHMLRAGFNPDIYVVNCLIDMYAKCGRIDDARQVFDKMPERDTCSWTTMLSGYANSCSMEDARDVFDKMPERSVVSWNAMIAGYTRSGLGKEKALNLYCEMQRVGMKPDGFTFASVLSVCAGFAALGYGKEIHVQIIKIGVEFSVFVGTALVDMYAKCGNIDIARRVFDEMPLRNVVSWTAMIVGYAQNGQAKEAVKFFRQVHCAGMRPNKLTFVGVMSACAILVDLDFGVQVLTQVIKSGFDLDVSVCNAMVTMYAKCGSIRDAQYLFDKMLERDLVSWNAMIAGYAQNGHGEKALKLGFQMQWAGVKPNQFTYASILSVCSSLPAFEEGKQLHGNITKTGFESNVFVASALVDLYGKSGNMDHARSLFEKIPQRDAISCNSMIAGYVQHGHGEKSLKLFFQMQHNDLEPDEATFASVVSACASLAVLEHGRHIHAHIISVGFESHINVANALVTMYAKCGSIEDGWQVFNKMVGHDLISWNAMITGYAQHGHGMKALSIFEEMLLTGMKPDAVTFLGVLSACSHAGLVDEGNQYFHSMSHEHHIPPRMDHCACMIDLLGRAGRLEEAEDYINNMPFEPDISIWMTLLSACRLHGNLEIGKRIAELLFTLEPQNTSSYVLLSNIYSAAGRWNDAAKVRKMMKDREVRKKPGCSWIEVKNRVHAFMSEDVSHPQTEEIYAVLKMLAGQMEDAGYVPNTSCVLHEMEDELKKRVLYHHSEKLAIAYGLISTPPGYPIRIIKNLRVCDDCHTAAKFISNIVGREVVIRDVLRFHHFKNGVCSCGDYW